MCVAVKTIELIDSIYRDGSDMPISLNKCNGSELTNVDVISLFRQTTSSTSGSVCYMYNTL